MPRIVTALFEDQARAQQALQALIETGLTQSQITAIGFSEGREVSSISGFRTLSAQDDSLAALDDLELPEADLRLFRQGLGRGCALIAARIDQKDLDEAIRVLEMFDPMDVDRDSREWARTAPSDNGAADVGRPLGAGVTGGTTEGMTNTDALPGMGVITDATDELGTADLRTDETAQPDMGPGSTRPTGDRRDDERAAAPGVNELELHSRPPAPRAGPFQRDTNRGGRVWAYGSD
jgi:hypothetical protein